MAETKPHIDRRLLEQRLAGLKLERSSWFSHWREISENVLPRNGRYFVTDTNRGERRHNSIYDSTGTRALRILAAGMMSGMTSPARPWFKLDPSDDELKKSKPVQIWLSQVTSLIHRVFQKSNTYRALHTMYEELGAFGTAASIVLPNFKNVIHHFPQTIGEYYIATNMEGAVCTLYREYQRTVAEVVKEFGKDKVSPATRTLFDNGSLDKWVTIVHAIEPRADRNPNMKDARNMPWASIYFERGSPANTFLRESGFKRFRVLAPRWAAAGGDIYGNSPGMEALGDIKQLQHEQLRKGQGIDYKTRPPLQAPTSMKNRETDMLPGGVTFVDAASPQGTIKSMWEVNLDLSHLLEDIRDVRERIRGCFYADLFLMLANQTDARMTATEVAERHEEKLLMLGPVLERLQNELLDPLIEMTFDEVMEAGAVPEPPPELQGQPINVELIGMLAQAMRAVGTNSIDRFVGSLGAVAQFKPNVLDKFDEDQWADTYADSLGIDPALVLPNDKVAAIREQRAKALAAAQQAELNNTRADTAQKLANAKTSEPSALTAAASAAAAGPPDATSQFSGYT